MADSAYRHWRPPRKETRNLPLSFAAVDGEGSVAVVTGASSGIGEATARLRARSGFDVVIGARRVERLERLAEEIRARAHRLDVTDPASVQEFAGHVGPCRVLVNNAGGAVGREPVSGADDEHWRWMFE